MATVTWTPDDSYRISGLGGYDISGSRTSDGIGMTPIDLISSSLALCVSITLVKLCERDGVELGPISVMVEATKAQDPPSRIERFSVSVALPPTLDESAKEKYVLAAERACTIGNTLKRGAAIDVRLAST
ncbi:MAG: OsmC family protein [Alicyclobacillus sp.]|nr:OsmC family protein [Alicyclobacillus sp.]